MTIFNTYKLFLKYKDNIDHIIKSYDQLYIENANNKYQFYTWLINEKKDLLPYVNEASKIIDLFDISYYNNLELYENIKIMNGPIDKARLIEIMQTENFIFTNTISN